MATGSQGGVVVSRTVRAGGCARCGYALRGTPIVEGVAVCPECGAAFIPALLRFREPAGGAGGAGGWPRWHAGLWLLGTLGVALAVCAAWLAG